MYHKKRIILLFFLLCLSLTLTGCPTSMERATLIVGAQQPLPYREGFAAGYDSSYAAIHPYFEFTKDVMRYQNDQLYKQGWDDGYQRAETEKHPPRPWPW